MTDREQYTLGPASGAQVRKDGEKWTLIRLRHYDGSEHAARVAYMNHNVCATRVTILTWQAMLSPLLCVRGREAVLTPALYVQSDS